MNKKIFIILICIIVLIVVGIIVFINRDEANSLNSEDYNIYNVNEETNITNNNEITERIQDITIQGVVELHHSGFIYIFNGQHFGEYGFEMEEYTMSNINDNKQNCIDFFTSKEFDTSYIEEGDILICKGDLIEYSSGNNDFDTKDNPIIVLKSNDFDTMKQATIKGERQAIVTVGEYFDFDGEIYLKYEISENGYKLPFTLKFNIQDDKAKVLGDLKKGETVKVQYKDSNVSLERLTIDSIEVY